MEGLQTGNYEEKDKQVCEQTSENKKTERKIAKTDVQKDANGMGREKRRRGRGKKNEKEENMRSLRPSQERRGGGKT